MTSFRTKPHSWLTGLVWLPDVERMKEEHDAEGLVLTLTHPRPKVRWASMRALGELWAIPFLVDLGDQDVDVRSHAAEVLGQLADKRAVGPLIASLWDPSVFYSDIRYAFPVRVNAIEALGKIADPVAIDPLMEALRRHSWGYPQKSAEVLYASLAAFGEPMFARLIATLQDKDEHMRELAIYALGYIKDPRAIGALDDALTHSENNWVLKRAAAQALDRIGGEKATSALLAALREETDSVAQSDILMFLSRNEDQRVTLAVFDALQRLAPGLREIAMGDIARFGSPQAREAVGMYMRREDR